MKNPEQVRRIEGMASAKTALDMAWSALATAYQIMAYVVPEDHPARKAILEASIGAQKAQEIAKQTLDSFKK